MADQWVVDGPATKERPTSSLRLAQECQVDDLRLVQECRVDDLDVSGSPRMQAVNLEHVRTLAEVEGDLPPIIVSRATMQVIDGRHRLAAAVMNGRRTITARFYEGSEADAFLLAVSTNVRHGLPLTLAERRAAAERIVRSHPNMSDRGIARAAGLAAKTVASIRASVLDGANMPPTRVGQDGRVRPLTTVEGRRAAFVLISSRPQASLREVARASGISVGTVRDVRKRMRAGQDPVPPGLRESEDDAASRTERPAAVPQDEPAPALIARSIVQRLRRDPTLRYTDAGRRLLRWLGFRSLEEEECRRMLEDVSPHCAPLISEFARQTAAVWVEVADELERRHGDAS